MNPQTIRTQTDLMKVRESYLANLEAEQRNLKKTADAVSIYNQTGQVPIAPQDTRSISEKLMDIEKLKINLRKQLMSITDGEQTAIIINNLSNDEIQAISIVIGDILPILQNKYKNGVPAPIFLEYIRRYLRDFGINMGLASGVQSVLAEELKLTRDMMSRVIPNPSIIQELMTSIASAPDSIAKENALLAVRELADALPNIDDIAATKNFLSEIELSNLSSLITDSLQTVPTASQVQKLTKNIINTLRGGDKKQTESILTKALETVKLERAELDQLNAVSEALRQEQQEQFAPKVTKPELPAGAVMDVARMANSKLKKVAGKIQLVEKAKYTDKDLKLAREVLDLDRMNEDDIAANKFSKSALVQYWDFISKRDTGKPITKEENQVLSALNNAELKQRIIDGKTSGDLEFTITPKKKSIEKKIAEQQTATNIGGVSAGVDMKDKAVEDYANQSLMRIEDFDTLDVDALTSYLNGLYMTNAVRDPDLIEEYKKYLATLHLDKTEGLKLLDKTKMITGMGMKKVAKKASKNIVFGCGLAKKQSKPKKCFIEKIDFTDGLPLDKSYIPFGKYVIHKHKLSGGILQVRTVKGGAIPKIPTLGISPALGKIIKKMVGGSLPTYDEMSSLNDDEKNTLYKVFKLSQVDKADMLPSPDKTKEEQEMNRFQILKGQIQAGNNSAELIREFKCMLMKFISGGKIPRGQGMDIVCELMALGY